MENISACWSRYGTFSGLHAMNDPRVFARSLGGDVTGRDSVNVPGPGHSKADRSLSIKLDSRAPDGFVVCSHAGDDPMACRDYVRDKLGLGRWERGKDYRTSIKMADTGPDPDQEKRKAFALKIWSESRNPAGSIVA